MPAQVRTILAGSRVLVTGASSGIGHALSALLVARGAKVVGTGRCKGELDEIEFVSTIVRDLTEPGAPEEVVDAAVRALGGLDILVSNAGAGWAGHYDEMTQDDLDRVLDLNLRAPMHLARAAAPQLAHGGQLVLVGSIAGLVGVGQEAAYCASKAGLRGLADSLREEWPAATVTLVSPGPVNTAFFDRRNRPYLRSWPKPVPVTRVVSAIVRALEHRRAEVVVPTWLELAARLHGGLPELYRALAGLNRQLAR
jgi:NAD(P)-dependent dehydrogenase (short-subunit alcohol dehydrogenase family)